MSLFISELAFGSGEQVEAAKVGILAASILAGMVGYFLMRAFAKKRESQGG
ncbi:MAG: Na(+)/H(+) antiporter NhaA, partial [Chloroflexi bacterium]